jgi:hypothetical protein
MDPCQPALTKEEETLHGHAVMLKKKLEAYHACESRDEMAWQNQFRALLVFGLLQTDYRPLSLF